MLGKLIKHEYSQTAKMFLPMFLGVLGLALLTAITSTLAGNIFTSNSPEGFLANLSMLLFFFTILALLALTFATLIIVIVRFYKNMLGDEGYLMFTLPTTAAQHIVAKTLVSVSWVLGSIVVNILSFAVIFYSEWGEAMSEIGYGISIFANEFGNGIYLTIALMIVLLILGMISSIMYYYMVIAIGGQWQNNRLTATVLAFFAINMGMQIVVMLLSASLILFLNGSTLDWLSQVITNANPITVVNVMMAIIMAFSIILSAIYFFVTRWLLSKKLNLA